MKKLFNNIKKDKKSLIIFLLLVYSIVFTYIYLDQRDFKKWKKLDIEDLTNQSLACNYLKDKSFLKEKLSKYSKEELTEKLYSSSFSANASLPIAMIELGAEIKDDYVIKLIALHSLAPSSIPLREIISYLIDDQNYKLSNQQKQNILKFIEGEEYDVLGKFNAEITYLKEKLKLESDKENSTFDTSYKYYKEAQDDHNN